MPRFRPMGLGDIFDEAFDLYRKNFLFLLLVAAAVVVPAHLIAPVLAARFAGAPSLDRYLTDVVGAFVPARTFSQLGPIFDGPAVFAPLYPLAAALEYAALAGACSACYLGGTRTLWAAYRAPLRRLLPLVVTSVLYALSIGLGMILCYVGVVLPLTWFAFTAHAFALEGKGFGGALGRSWRLVAGDGGRVFGCLMLLSLLSTVVGLGIRLPLVYVFDTALNLAPDPGLLSGGAASAGSQRRLVEQTCEGLAALVMTPFLFSVLTVFYYDLRVRKEAFDVDLLARGLGYPPLSALGGFLPPALLAPPAPAVKAPPFRKGAPR